MDERERRRQRRYREAMRNRVIAVVFLAALIVGIIFIVKGCRDKSRRRSGGSRRQRRWRSRTRRRSRRAPSRRRRITSC